MDDNMVHRGSSRLSSTSEIISKLPMQMLHKRVGYEPIWNRKQNKDKEYILKSTSKRKETKSSNGHNNNYHSTIIIRQIHLMLLPR